MFIKSITIKTPTAVIRNLTFKKGLNLIIDNTSTTEMIETGNNIGKTTVLKLIDFCLGAKPSIIYSDTENSKKVYTLVEEFLVNKEIEIILTLSEDLANPNAKEITICRNFLKRKNAKRTINGTPILEKDFESELQRFTMDITDLGKPTYRQIISHNIRYKDDHINNTLKTLDKYTTDIEYETLYLYLLGCTFDNGAKKLELSTKLKQEITFKERLEKKQTKNSYEVALSFLNDEIETLQNKKKNFNLNQDFEKDLNRLNQIKYEINKLSTKLSKLEARKTIIEEVKAELESDITNIDIQQLQDLYSEVKLNIDHIQKTFEDLVNYHNKMIAEKSKYISNDLPYLNNQISEIKKTLTVLLYEEKELTELVSKKDSFDELESIVTELNNKYQLKGEYESIIKQINEAQKNIHNIQSEIETISHDIYSQDYEETLKKQINKFNKYFSNISQELYGERHALTYNLSTNKNQQQVYKFDSFNAISSTGKKQGEILCFDLAYTLFADNEKIPTMHFLLNDKKELMHDNQLVKVAEFIKDKNVQLIVSILKDKIPQAAIDNAHTVVELSQSDKLFRIEQYGD